MSLAVVQHNTVVHGSGVPGAVTIGSTPTAGNLLIAFLGVNLTTSSMTINTSGWTRFDGNETSDGSNTTTVALYRYVQGGDTSTLPAFFTAGSTYYAHSVYEISGVSGTWENDFLISSSFNNSSLVNTTIPAFDAIANGSLALAFVGSYNGNSNPSISGSWTLDDAANNNSNYGSVGCAHRSMSSGDTLDGAWTAGTSAPLGAIYVILTATAATTIQPRHFHRIASNTGSSHPGSITVPWTPKTGNLVLAYIGWDRGSATNPTLNTTDWTEFKFQNGASTKMLIGLYRYVQGGDTAALPALTSAGADFYSVSIVEIAGISGTFGSDHINDQSGTQGTGATQTTTSDTTTANTQLGLIAYANYDGTTPWSIDSSFVKGIVGVDSGDYGSWGVAFKKFPTSGTTVQATITPSNTSDRQTYIQSIFASIGGSSFTADVTESITLSDSTDGAIFGSSSLTESITLAASQDASISLAAGNVTVVIIQ